MRLAGLFLISLFVLVPASFLPGARAQAPAPAVPLQQMEVPSGTPQTVAIITRDFAPGQAAGRHIHKGVEMFVVTKGDFLLSVDGSPPRTLHAGDSSQVARDVPHDIKNVGTTPGSLAITYVIDKGAPLRVPVP
jgi:quercetin dioxygenase-like cupin family protein